MTVSGIDQQPVAYLDLTVFDTLPRLAEADQPYVVDGQVFARGKVVKSCT